MKIIGILISTVFLTTSAIAQDTAVIDQARTALEKGIAEFNNGNYESYFTILHEDLQAYAGVYTPLRFDGKVSWQDFIEGLGDFESVNYEQRGAVYRSFGKNIVLCNAYFVFTTKAENGTTETQTGRESTTLVNVNGQWLVANFHFSPIF